MKVKLVDSLIEDHSFSAEFVRWIEGKADLKHLRVFFVEQFVLSISVLLLTLCVTISTNLTNVLLINYTWIGSAFI